MSFRDEHERKAHDIICLIKYNGVGGQVREAELRKVANILRGGPLVPKITMRIPGSNPPPPPTIRLP